MLLGRGFHWMMPNEAGARILPPQIPQKEPKIWRFPPKTSTFGSIRVNVHAPFKRPFIPRSRRAHGRAFALTSTRYSCQSTNLPPPKGLFRDGSPSTPFGSGRINRGCTWQGLLSLHLLLWLEGGGALGKAFFLFPIQCGTRAVGGGVKRSTSESDD